MSYAQWTVDGYGMDVSEVINNLKPEGISLLSATIYIFWEQGNPLEDYGRIEDDEQITEINNWLYKRSNFDPTDVCGSLETMRNLFKEFEDNDCCSQGFDSFICCMFSWLWKINGHDTSIITLVNDYMNDDHCYWMLSTVYPWYQSEFKDEEECKNAILNSMKGLVLEEYINTQSISQDG